MNTFRMEPLVVDALQVASLFQTGILVVNGIDDIHLVANNMQFASRHSFHLVKYQTIEGQLLNLVFKRFLSP